MTPDEIRQIIREELRAFFGNHGPAEPEGEKVARFRSMAADDLAAARLRKAEKIAKKQGVKRAA